MNRDNALYDPEPNCKVAYRPDEEESQATEWSDDLDLAAVKGYAASSKDLPIAFKAKSQAKRRGQEEGPERMQQDIPVDVDHNCCVEREARDLDHGDSESDLGSEAGHAKGLC